MKRIKAATKANPRKVLMSICALAVASAIVVGSGANFTSSTANPGNVYTAGNLKHTNSKDGAAIFTADKMKPGETRSGTVDIANTGDIDGVFTLSKSVNDAAGTPSFSAKLDLKVVDCGDPASPNCATGSTVYNGKVSAMGSQALGTFVPSAAHQYEFQVKFPDGGANGADNAYKAAKTTVQFDWESVNN